MSDYEIIISDIKSKLTGDKSKDIKYLMIEKDKYKNHPMAREILKEIGRMLYDNLPKENKNGLADAFNMDLKIINNKIIEANELIKKGQFAEARIILNEYIAAGASAYKEDQVTRYFNFDNLIEFYCSKEKIKTDKKIVWVDLRLDVAYKLLAYIANEEKEYEKAREYIDKGLHYNPMSLELRFEKVESYKIEKDIEKMYELTIQIYPYIYDSNNLARYYRLLGYYYIEKNKLELAYSLYAISIYYQMSQIALNEINFIKQQFGNPDYKLSTKEIIENLNKNRISLTIKESNLKQLTSLSNEKEVNNKQPILVEQIKNNIKFLSNKPNENVEIRGLSVEQPKITTEDIFDEDKIIFDEQDKVRIKQNIEILKQKGIPFIEDMKTIPFNSCTNLKSKEEILSNLIVNYAVATCALYSLEGKANIIGNIIDEMDNKFQLKRFLSNNDSEFLNAIKEKKVSKQYLQDATWVFEECAVLMWILGLMDKPEPSKECNVNKIDELLFHVQNYNELLLKCNLKSKEEVLEYADLIFRYSWACRENKMKEQPLTTLNEMVIQEHRVALEWVLNWKLEKLMKDVININFVKGNFNFNFMCPTSLHIDDITNSQNLTLLFSLADSTGHTVIELHDLGLCNSPNRLKDFYEIDKEKYKNFKYNIVGEYSVSSPNLESEFKQLILYKELNNVKDEKLCLIVYYFVLNGNIVCMKNILTNDVDYSNLSNIQNSKRATMGTTVLLSLNEKNFKNNMVNNAQNIATKMNFKLHSQQLDIPVLDHFKIKNVNDPQIILSATDGMFMEQLVSNGPMKVNETFEQRINLVVKNTVNFLKKYSQANNDNSIFYYKDYSNGTFDYKVYVQDFIVNVDGTSKVIRQLIAYFIEPKFNDFYQLSISSPALSMPTEKLKLGEVDIVSDQTTQSLENLLKGLMDNLKYNIDDSANSTNKNTENKNVDNQKESSTNLMVDYEKVLNDILPGLTMYVRDVNLDKRLEKKYIPNTIILEKGFTDASVRVKGMNTTHRFAILSNHMLDLSSYENETNWGLFAAPEYSHFLILDKYEYKGKMQILLLHLPNDDRWKMFKDVKLNILDEMIKNSRFRFEKKCEQGIIPELSTKDWIDRCAKTLGMDNKGNLFDINEVSIIKENNIETKSEEDNMNYGYVDENEPSIINNEYDYSNIIPAIEGVEYLAQYMENEYKQFMTLVDEDERKNEQFKQEFKIYNYKKSYGERFEIYIREKSYNNITCKDFSSFQSAIKDGNLKNIVSLEIRMELDFKRGKGNELSEHENSFTVIFKPYEITFARKSSYNELKMNQIEKNINAILKQFNVANSIFCTK